MTDNSQHLPLGHKIGHHYEIIEILGQGGFGIVYLVKDTHRVKDNIFVIKELFVRSHSFRHRGNTTVGTSQKIKNIFEKIKTDIIREVDILSSIANPNIVQAYGYIKENRTIYSIMEHIMGDDLEEYIKENSFDENMAMDLLKQLINGLEEIHSQNIIHRDLKPSNIMRTKDGIYKIIDFTTNKTYSDKETNITNINSPGYTAPELEKTRAVIGKFSDIYSLGMTLYKILSLKNPPTMADRFNDSDFQQGIDDLNVSSGFKEIICKMTTKEVDDRFESLGEIAESLNKEIKSFKELFDWADKYNISKEKFPRDIDKLKELAFLNLNDNNLEEIPESIGILINLKELSISNSILLDSLKYDTVMPNNRGNKIIEIPNSISNLINLEVLDIGGNQIKSLPENIGNLISLKKLYIWDNKIERLPKSIGRLINLEELDISWNNIEKLPTSIGNLINLTYLDIKFNRIEELPNSIRNLKKLDEDSKDKLKKIPIQNIFSQEEHQIINNGVDSF